MSPPGCQTALLTSNLHSTVAMLTISSCYSKLLIKSRSLKLIWILVTKTWSLLQKQVDDILPFLDIKVIRAASAFVTSVYRKPTFSGVYTNYISFLPQIYKSGLIRTLLFRLYTICLDWNMVHKEIEHLKSVMRRNAYPDRFIDSTINHFSQSPLRETCCRSTTTGCSNIPAFSAISRNLVIQNWENNQQGV